MASSVETVRTQLVAALNTIHPSTLVEGVALRSDVKQVNMLLQDIMIAATFPQLCILIDDDTTTAFDGSQTLYQTVINFRIVGMCQGSTGTTGTSPQTYVNIELEKLIDDVRRVLMSKWLTYIAASPAWIIDMYSGLKVRREFDWKNNTNKGAFVMRFTVARYGHCLVDS